MTIVEIQCGSVLRGNKFYGKVVIRSYSEETAVVIAGQ